MLSTGINMTETTYSCQFQYEFIILYHSWTSNYRFKEHDAIQHAYAIVMTFAVYISSSTSFPQHCLRSDHDCTFHMSPWPPHTNLT